MGRRMSSPHNYGTRRLLFRHSTRTGWGTCPLIHPNCFRSRSRYLFYRHITLTLSEKQFGCINGQVPWMGYTDEHVKITSRHVASLRAGLTLVICWTSRRGQLHLKRNSCRDGRHAHLLSVWSC